jgi:hypothetical protein
LKGVLGPVRENQATGAGAFSGLEGQKRPQGRRKEQGTEQGIFLPEQGIFLPEQGIFLHEQGISDDEQRSGFALTLAARRLKNPSLDCAPIAFCL